MSQNSVVAISSMPVFCLTGSPGMKMIETLNVIPRCNIKVMIWSRCASMSYWHMVEVCLYDILALG